MDGVCPRVGVLPVCTTDPHQNGGSVMVMDATSQEKGKIKKGAPMVKYVSIEMFNDLKICLQDSKYTSAGYKI